MCTDEAHVAKRPVPLELTAYKASVTAAKKLAQAGIPESRSWLYTKQIRYVKIKRNNPLRVTCRGCGLWSERM